MKKSIQVFEVLNEAGQRVATYRAINAQAAVAAHERDQAIYFSTFRRGAPRRRHTYTAQVKKENDNGYQI